MTDLTGKLISNTYKQLLRLGVSTNSGVSAIIGRKGEVLKRQGIFEQKELKGKIYLNLQKKE